jgi:hypothetical protein
MNKMLIITDDYDDFKSLIKDKNVDIYFRRFNDTPPWLIIWALWPFQHFCIEFNGSDDKKIYNKFLKDFPSSIKLNSSLHIS